MEKRELLYSVERNINWGTENSMVVSQKTGNRTYHMTQQFHSWIYIQKKEKTLIWKDTCAPMLTAAPLPIAKIWKQPKCPSTDEWIKKMWFIYSLLKVAQMVKNLPAMQERPRFSPWVGKITCWREWQPTPVFLPGEFLYNEILLTIKQDWNFAICTTQMDLEHIMLSEISRIEKDKHCISLVCTT